MRRGLPRLPWIQQQPPTGQAQPEPSKHKISPSVRNIVSCAHQLDLVAALTDLTTSQEDMPTVHKPIRVTGSELRVDAVLMGHHGLVQQLRAQLHPMKGCHHHQQRRHGPSQAFCWRRVPMAIPRIRERPLSRMAECHRRAPVCLLSASMNCMLGWTS